LKIINDIFNLRNTEVSLSIILELLNYATVELKQKADYWNISNVENSSLMKRSEKNIWQYMIWSVWQVNVLQEEFEDTNGQKKKYKRTNND
jgi:hypothetical protein